MAEIEELTEQLTEEIQEFSEYQELVEAEGEYENDSEAQELLVQIRQTENEIRKAHREGEDHSKHEELHGELENLQDELDQLGVVQRYYEAAEEFQERLDESVNDNLDDTRFEITL